MQQQWANSFRDIARALREILTAVAVVILVVWIVHGVDLARVTRLDVPLVGKLELKEIEQHAQASANNIDAAKDEVASLRGRVDQLAKEINEAGGNKDLKNALAATQKAAAEAQVRLAESAQDNARALARIAEAKAQIDPNAAAPPGSGWYYLGKVSKDGTKWLPSSALDNVRFVPPLTEGEDIRKQLASTGTREVYSTGYKYLRSKDTLPGNRVAGQIDRTLSPNTRVRISEIDASGQDGGDTVVWALVQVPEAGR